jgi:hypothetical protein
MTIGSTTTAGFSVSSTLLTQVTGCGTVPTDNGSSIPVVTSIKLPNGQEYQFTYDPTYGLLSKIKYPWGGFISYTWGLNSQAAIVSYAIHGGGAGTCYSIYDKPALVHRSVSYDGNTVALQQDFSYTTTWSSNPILDGWTSKQTTVTTHDLIQGTSFKTIYTFSGVPAPIPPFTDTETINNDDGEIPQESQVVYQDNDGSVLKTVKKTWHDIFVEASEQDTLGSSGPTSQVNYTYGPGDQVTEKDEFDFGQATPTRKTLTTYQSFAATPIFTTGPSIFDRPSSVIVQDTNGNHVAETDYAYDQTGPSAVSSSLPSGTHDETNYSSTSSAPRGNATTIRPGPSNYLEP